VSQMSFLMASPREAHAALMELWKIIKAHARKGARSVVTWHTVNAHRRSAQRAAFHGPVLRTIAMQVWLYDPVAKCRVRYHPLTWKRYFAELYIEPTFSDIVDPDTGEIRQTLDRRSTEALTDDEFAEFLARVQAFAVTDLNVTFPEDQEYEQ
jgi:hypothetical protein